MVDGKSSQNTTNEEVVARIGMSPPPLYGLVPLEEIIEVPEPTYSTLYEPTKPEQDGKRNGEVLVTTDYLGIGTEMPTLSLGPSEEKQIERLTLKIRGLEATSDYLHAQVDKLKALLSSIRSRKLADICDALVDKPAVFILDVLYNRDSIKLSEVERNIDSAKGWMMVGRLLKAGLIDERGEELYITEAGREFCKKVERLVTSSGK